MRPWRLLDSGPGNGAFNMAVDEALLQCMGSSPVLRFYRWAPPAISFGFAQDIGREIDVEKCKAEGLDLVRRYTGGRAVLHWDELTYSVVCRRDDAELGGRLEDTYCRIGHCLVEGLRAVGVAAELERARPRPVAPRNAGAVAPCFSSIARWEVKCGGRKLVGSAQRQTRDVILQHGSLPLGAHYRRLPEFMPEALRHLLPAMAQRLRQGSIHLRACVNRELGWDELVAGLREGFCRHLGIEFEVDQLSGKEERCVAALVKRHCGDVSSVNSSAVTQREGEFLVGI